MFDSDRANLTDCQKLSYRRSVESLTGNGHESKVYRIEWVRLADVFDTLHLLITQPAEWLSAFLDA
jgi:hypothetical protein